MPQRPPLKQAAPAEILAQLNLGINLYTDPTQTTHKMWSAANLVYAGPFGYIQRARFANVVTGTATGVAPSSLKFYAVPTLSNYLLEDIGNGFTYQYNANAAYAKVQVINPYWDPAGTGSPLLVGPWMREVLQNIAYGMNGQVKQAQRQVLASDQAYFIGWVQGTAAQGALLRCPVGDRSPGALVTCPQ